MTPKDRMVIVCCGCGEQTDLPTVTKLVNATPTCITYLATCRCGYKHTIMAVKG